MYSTARGTDYQRYSTATGTSRRRNMGVGPQSAPWSAATYRRDNTESKARSDFDHATSEVNTHEGNDSGIFGTGSSVLPNRDGEEQVRDHLEYLLRHALGVSSTNFSRTEYGVRPSGNGQEYVRRSWEYEIPKAPRMRYSTLASLDEAPKIPSPVASDTPRAYISQSRRSSISSDGIVEGEFDDPFVEPMPQNPYQKARLHLHRGFNTTTRAGHGGASNAPPGFHPYIRQGLLLAQGSLQTALASCAGLPVRAPPGFSMADREANLNALSALLTTQSILRPVPASGAGLPVRAPPGFSMVDRAANLNSLNAQIGTQCTLNSAASTQRPYAGNPLSNGGVRYANSAVACPLQFRMPIPRRTSREVRILESRRLRSVSPTP